MATHSSIFASRSPWTEKRGGLKSMGMQEELDNPESLSTHIQKPTERFSMSPKKKKKKKKSQATLFYGQNSTGSLKNIRLDPSWLRQNS